MMKPSETFAKSCVEATVPGSRMVFREEQHQRVHDFDLYLPDGTIAAVEVSAAVDSEVLSAESAILDENRGGQFLPRVHSKHDWYITLRSSANIGRLRRELDSAMAAVEREGLQTFESELHRYESPAVQRLSDMGVDHGTIAKWDEPGIALTLGGDSVWLSIGPVLSAVRAVAARPDNVEKLQLSQRDSRHLFVYVDMSLGPAWLCLREVNGGPLPNLPVEVTDVWVGGAFGLVGRGLYARVSHGRWSRFGPVQLTQADGHAA